MPEDGKQLNQANLIDLLRKVSFAEHHCPDIQLHHITLQHKVLAILQIRNVRMKPYYLTQDYSKEGKTVRAGVVYTRQQDANTPVNGRASPGDVMAMWKEHFDLDLVPTDRIVKHNDLQEEDGVQGKCVIDRGLWMGMNQMDGGLNLT